jgi:hypothetical protein
VRNEVEFVLFVLFVFTQHVAEWRTSSQWIRGEASNCVIDYKSNKQILNFY